MDLDTEISPEQWHTSFTFTHKSSISGFSQEKNYRLLSRWYRDPVMVNKMYPNTLDACWCCHEGKGSYLHMWRECDRVRPFWNKVFGIYNNLYNASLVPSPTVALLSILPGPIKTHKKSLLRFFLSAARHVILQHWKTETIPPISG